ncbi:uncharacterized protein LOC108094665 [Drosophila ficusphila]|uniref:uncharacterized protein LOC108094665 n=1 Tax=Drosophila ficusphila TaxID=30025 RepID=UPI0007E5E343|nr:uncharacterized protein LOC108094665 [Drosophila ficusphila]
MDLFIRKELTLSSGTQLEDVTPHCQKLLTWLQSFQEEFRSEHRHLRLNPSLIESLLKAHLYLFECYERFGDSLADRCDSHGFFAGISSMEERRQYIRELCTNIVNTKRGEEHAPLLHLMHRTFAEVQTVWSVIRDLDWSEIRQSEALACSDLINPDLQQMRRLVKRICRLSSLQQIETAVQRSMELISFVVWIYLFREPRDSSIHSDCHLVRNLICDTLTEGRTSACSGFLHNIYRFVSEPGNEVRFWACLEHVRLAGSLISYLIGSWSCHLPFFDVEEMQMNAEAPELGIAQLPVDKATYVTHLMLAVRSPCRQQFSQQLRTLLPTNSLACLLDLLNKVAFVFS